MPPEEVNSVMHVAKRDKTTSCGLICMLLPGGGGGPSAASPGSPQPNLPAETMQEAADQMEGGEEGRVVGHVKWQVYTAYMKAVGTGLVLFVLLSLALMQASVSCT